MLIRNFDIIRDGILSSSIDFVSRLDILPPTANIDLLCEVIYGDYFLILENYLHSLPCDVINPIFNSLYTKNLQLLKHSLRDSISNNSVKVAVGEYSFFFKRMVCVKSFKFDSTTAIKLFLDSTFSQEVANTYLIK